MIRPKPPLFAWAKMLEGALPNSPDQWTSVDLIAESDTASPAQLIRWHFRTIFEEQLEAWHRIDDDWPTPRPLALFHEWFQADVVDLAFDLSGTRPEHDD